MPQLQELAPDPPVPPARVLGGQPHDQPADVGRERRATGAAAMPERGPLAAHQLPVPAQQRLGPDREAPPLGAGQQAAEPGQDEAVAGVVAGPLGLAAQDPDLLTQDEELDVAGRARPRANEEQVEQQTDARVGDREEHGGEWSPQPISHGHRARPIRYSNPTAVLKRAPTRSDRPGAPRRQQRRSRRPEDRRMGFLHTTGTACGSRSTSCPACPTRRRASRLPRVLTTRGRVRDLGYLAPRPGFEPGTYRLTAGRSTVELSGIDLDMIPDTGPAQEGTAPRFLALPVDPSTRSTRLAPELAPMPCCARRRPVLQPTSAAAAGRCWRLRA